MKKIITILFFSFSMMAFAQRYENGIYIQGSYGAMPDKGQISPYASTASLGAGYIIGNKGFLAEVNVFAQDYLIKHQELDLNLPYQILGLSLMPGWSYENLYPIYFNIKAGGFAGYEMINKTQNIENQYEVKVPGKIEQFVYGAVGQAEIEYNFYQNFSVGLSYHQYFNIKSNWQRFQYFVAIGVKYYF